MNSPAQSKTKRVLISTILPGAGGVPAMTSFVIQLLRERSYEPIIVYYAPYSLEPDLSVPAWQALGKKPGMRRVDDVDGCETYAMGAWLPELEVTHYSANSEWDWLIDSCDYHIAVAGSAHALKAFYKRKLPYLGWIATGWEEDIMARGAQFSWPRKLFSKLAVEPAMLRLEKDILRSGTVLPLSAHTQNILNTIIGNGRTNQVMPMPVDGQFFSPSAKSVDHCRVGFSGRLGDPRKNLKLLLEAIALLVKQGSPVTLELIGGEVDDGTQAIIDGLNIGERVNAPGFLSREGLVQKLQSLSAYIIPSHQEGLCIAALEAMACGAPVISTRCGGPSEYVIDGETGYLVDFNARDMADRIQEILTNNKLQSNLSNGARKMVEEQYSRERAKNIFWDAFDRTFA